MHADHWRRVEALYHAAYERPVHERGAFLDEVCAGDARLRAEVESLLVQPVSADGSLERAARGVAPPPTPRRFAAGTRLGSYEIIGPLGIGGMGEVYRARDSQLHRDVALKVLPELSALHPDRLARFRREAQVLASLNHPNIGAIYGFEDADGMHALVLELVDGPTLADRLAQGPILLHDALPIARQMCEALAAAHERGVIHRDLKPANIKLRPDGTVKVLDFGLAKVFVGDGSAANLSRSPTVTLGGTREGVILGTAAYMSPEQARGLTVDKRTDIWAFACVLYEMLTGRALFLGPTVTDTLAAILEREPMWDTLPGATPPVIRRLLQRCLEKDPRQRLRDIADARMEIEDGLRGGARTAAEIPVVVRTRPRVRVQWAMAAVTLLAALIAIGAWSAWHQAPATADPDTAGSSRPTAQLAVLPFKVLTVGETEQYLGLGIADALITQLANVKTLKVRPTAVVIRYDTQAPDPRQAGRELEAEHVLAGTLQKAGEMYRISVQLIRTADGVAIWGRTYDVPRPDLSTIETRVSEEVAEALRVQLTARPGGVPPRNPAAYEEYLQGRALLVNYSEAKMGAAIESFERAIQLDPDYASAHAGLATARAWFSVRFAYEEDAVEWGRRAESSASRALALNPALAEAHLAIAGAAGTLYGRFNWRRLLDETEQALNLDPTLDLAHTARSRAFYHLGLFDAADAAAEAAIQLNPASNVETERLMVASELFSGRFAAARNRAEQLVGQTDAPVIRMYLGEALFYLGERKKAADLLAGIKRGESVDIRSQAALAGVLASMGDAARAKATIGTILGGPYMDHHVAYSLGTAFAQLGRPDDAIRWLQTAVADGFPCYPWFASDPLLEPLRDHAGYRHLMDGLRRTYEEARVRYVSRER